MPHDKTVRLTLDGPETNGFYANYIKRDAPSRVRALQIANKNLPTIILFVLPMLKNIYHIVVDVIPS